MTKRFLHFVYFMLLGTVILPASTLVYPLGRKSESSRPHGLQVSLPPQLLVVGVPPTGGYANAWAIDGGDGSSDSLSLSDASFGDYNTNIWAVSIWFQRSTLGSMGLWAHDGFSGSYDSPIRIQFDFVGGADKLRVRTVATGTTTDGELATTFQFQDTNWYHAYIVFDITQPAGDQLRLWTNAVRVTNFATETMPTAAVRTSAQDVWIGRLRQSANSFLGNYDEVAFFSGSYPDVTEIYDTTTHKPKDLTGLTGLYSWVPSSETNFQYDVVKGIYWGVNGSGITNTTTVP